MTTKEVQIVYRLFLVNFYLLHENIQSEIEANRDRTSIIEVFTIYMGGLVIEVALEYIAMTRSNLYII